MSGAAETTEVATGAKSRFTFPFFFIFCPRRAFPTEEKARLMNIQEQLSTELNRALLGVK